MTIVVDSFEEYRQKWNSRLRATSLDYFVLFLGAYSTESIYPYSIHQFLGELWGENDAPPLPTIYSTIDRLAKNDLISIGQEIVSNRIQKVIKTTPTGFDLMNSMVSDFKEIEETINKIHEMYGVDYEK